MAPLLIDKPALLCVRERGGEGQSYTQGLAVELDKKGVGRGKGNWGDDYLL